MGLTNEFERDLEDQAGLKRPGRIDFRILQNTADAGDGHPGLQKCFRNYLHEGGMEKDLELVSFGIKGTSVDINNAELQQLSNIGDATIIPAQWGYVGGANQPLKTADPATFAGLTINGNIAVTGTVDSVDIAEHDHSGANQGGTVLHSSTSGRTANDHHNQSHVLSGGDHTASGLTVGYVVRATAATTFAWAQLDHGDLSGIGSNAHSAIDTHITSTTTPHVSSAEKTNWNSAHSHITQDGSSHSFIGQDVTINGTPTFGSLSITNNITVGGTVDTINISAFKSDYDSKVLTYNSHINDSAIHFTNNQLKMVNASSNTNTETVYTKLKETKINTSQTSITFYWQHKVLGAGGAAYTKLYKNGNAVGVQKTTGSTSYVLVSDTITVADGDLIQVYGYNNEAPTWGVGVQNFYFYWTGCLAVL